jgi:hypothetical protein
VRRSVITRLLTMAHEHDDLGRRHD